MDINQLMNTKDDLRETPHQEIRTVSSQAQKYTKRLDNAMELWHDGARAGECMVGPAYLKNTNTIPHDLIVRYAPERTELEGLGGSTHTPSVAFWHFRRLEV